MPSSASSNAICASRKLYWDLCRDGWWRFSRSATPPTTRSRSAIRAAVRSDQADDPRRHGHDQQRLRCRWQLAHQERRPLCSGDVYRRRPELSRPVIYSKSGTPSDPRLDLRQWRERQGPLGRSQRPAGITRWTYNNQGRVASKAATGGQHDPERGVRVQCCRPVYPPHAMHALWVWFGALVSQGAPISQSVWEFTHPFCSALMHVVRFCPFHDADYRAGCV
jgi:YD repeat-containing protein